MRVEAYQIVLAGLLLLILVGSALLAFRCWPRPGATDRSHDRFALALAVALMSFRSLVLVLNGIYAPETEAALRLLSMSVLASAALLVWMRAMNRPR